MGEAARDARDTARKAIRVARKAETKVSKARKKMPKQDVAAKAPTKPNPAPASVNLIP